jgi:hypothetical protein
MRHFTSRCVNTRSIGAPRLFLKIYAFDLTNIFFITIGTNIANY